MFRFEIGFNYCSLQIYQIYFLFFVFFNISFNNYFNFNKIIAKGPFPGPLLQVGCYVWFKGTGGIFSASACTY